MSEASVIVIGAGVSGLTAANLLAKEGLPVSLLEAHHQVGGCAGTFCRSKYVFDVGATQVAGLEPGGIHNQIFSHLNIDLPMADVLDLACLVDLLDGSDPIHLWHDQSEWIKERQRQFPGSDLFWTLCTLIHKSNWAFVKRNPVLPIANSWDLFQFLHAVRLPNILTASFTSCSITDLLKICGCDKDQRLRKFLDLQLKLYSQESADATSALYGATVLNIAQAPLGLWHLDGSMQSLSEILQRSFLRLGGNLFLNHRVFDISFSYEEKTWIVKALSKEKKCITFVANDVVFSLPPQTLPSLIKDESIIPFSYKKKLACLPIPSSAVVFYGALERRFLPLECPGHIQLGTDVLGSIFISISRDGDGRAPIGEATLIASIFAEISDWKDLDKAIYKEKKQNILDQIVSCLESWLEVDSLPWLHKELATPRSFSKWTGRPDGIVGGLGQRPSSSGLFGLPSRTPMKGFWLCGDSIHPGEGTAGVSQSALMACRQLMATHGRFLALD